MQALAFATKAFKTETFGTKAIRPRTFGSQTFGTKTFATWTLGTWTFETQTFTALTVAAQVFPFQGIRNTDVGYVINRKQCGANSRYMYHATSDGGNGIRIFLNLFHRGSGGHSVHLEIVEGFPLS